MSIGVALGVATLIAGSSVGGGAAEKISAQIDQMFGPGTILIGSAELKLPDLEAVADEDPTWVQVTGVVSYPDSKEVLNNPNTLVMKVNP